MYLNCHSHYSFKYGTLSPEALIAEARRCGVHKLMLTDINNTSAWVEMFRLCAELAGEYRLEAGLGIEFRTGFELRYIGLAAGNAGFEALNRFLSAHNRDGTPLPLRAPELPDTFFIYPAGAAEPGDSGKTNTSASGRRRYTASRAPGCRTGSTSWSCCIR
jgi:DNA polymerase III alpha subunit